MEQVERNPWVKETLDTILKYIELSIPLNIVYFPSCGLLYSLELLEKYTTSRKYKVFTLHLPFISSESRNYYKKNSQEHINLIKEQASKLIEKESNSYKRIIFILLCDRASKIYEYNEFIDLIYFFCKVSIYYA